MRSRKRLPSGDGFFLGTSDGTVSDRLTDPQPDRPTGRTDDRLGYGDPLSDLRQHGALYPFASFLDGSGLNRVYGSENGVPTHRFYCSPSKSVERFSFSAPAEKKAGREKTGNAKNAVPEGRKANLACRPIRAKTDAEKDVFKTRIMLVSPDGMRLFVPNTSFLHDLKARMGKSFETAKRRRGSLKNDVRPTKKSCPTRRLTEADTEDVKTYGTALKKQNGLKKRIPYTLKTAKKHFRPRCSLLRRVLKNDFCFALRRPRKEASANH